MRSRILITFFLLILLLGFYNPGLLATAPNRVLIIDLPRLSLNEITTGLPHLLELVESGAVGIMTTSMKEPVSIDRVYFGFNSGVQLKTVEENYLLFNVTEEYKGIPAGRFYHSITGYKAPSKGVVHLGLAKITQLNKDGSSTIGLFGSLLRQNSIKTGAIGNADTDLINRCGALMIMDEQGRIDFGAVGEESLQVDPLFPFGLRTDINQTFAAWKDFNRKAQVIVVSLGDLERLERYNLYLTDKQWSFYRNQVLLNYDQLIGQFIKEVDFNSTMILVFTAAPSERKAGIGERLSPVIVKGPGFSGGLLYSGSTRKPGIITCYDLPATILQFLKINKSKYFSGHILRWISGDWQYIAREQPQLVKNYSVRWPLLTIYGYMLIGLVLAGLAGMVFWPHRYRLFEWLAYVYLFLLTIPAIFLVEAVINPLDWVSIIGWTVGLAVILWSGAVYFARGNHLTVLSVISIITAGFIIFDGFFNGFLEFKSFFGYSAIAGARFYGIGNEYMGFLLGAYIVAISLNLSRLGRYKKEILWLAVCFMAVFLAHPNLGANIGGGITALIGLGITTHLWLGRPIRLKEIVGLTAAMITLLFLIGLWDFYISGYNITHFGQLIKLIKDQGFKVIGDLVNRKLELNFRLIAYTPWTKILIGILIVIPFIYKRPPVAVARLIRKYPDLIRGFFGLTLTAIVALIINDSGIVTVSTMYIFGIPLIMLVILKEWGPLKGVDE